jgi:stearoyl-CoA desaturase (delta-9 desaturase)
MSDTSKVAPEAATTPQAPTGLADAAAGLPDAPLAVAGKEGIDWNHSGTWLFTGVHLVAIAGVVYFGWSWKYFALAVGMYFFRMFGITAGYHRYFSHRTYKTSRFFQFVLAFLGTTCTQKGVLWWAAHHRSHHKHSDSPKDIHSPKQRGFWWAHIGWVLAGKYNETDYKRIPDFAKYPELRWLNRFYLVPVVLFAVTLWLIGSWQALLWGYFVSTSMLWHGTFVINSLTHVFGKRRYETTDDSRNSFILALVTMGEGWHNNHHYYQLSTNQGFFWWEIDVSYYILRVLSWFRVVWDITTPPKKVLEGNQYKKPVRQAADSARPAAVPVAVRAVTSVLPPS